MAKTFTNLTIDQLKDMSWREIKDNNYIGIFFTAVWSKDSDIKYLINDQRFVVGLSDKNNNIVATKKSFAEIIKSYKPNLLDVSDYQDIDINIMVVLLDWLSANNQIGVPIKDVLNIIKANLIAALLMSQYLEKKFIYLKFTIANDAYKIKSADISWDLLTLSPVSSQTSLLSYNISCNIWGTNNSNNKLLSITLASRWKNNINPQTSLQGLLEQYPWHDTSVEDKSTNSPPQSIQKVVPVINLSNAIIDAIKKIIK